MNVRKQQERTIKIYSALYKQFQIKYSQLQARVTATTRCTLLLCRKYNKPPSFFIQMTGNFI